MHDHAIPKTTYYKIAGWLFLLMILTVAAGQYDLGHWNTPIAMGIAIVKAVLILLFFMHVRYGSPLLKLFAAGGFLWLGILLTITMADYLTRPPRVERPTNAPPAAQKKVASRSPHSATLADVACGTDRDRKSNQQSRDAIGRPITAAIVDLEFLYDLASLELLTTRA